MTIALAIEKLALIRGHRRLFADLDFALGAGEFLVLEGRNGAGKTSLLRVVAGLLAPTAGIVRIRTDGGDAVDGEDRARLAGWLGDKDGVKPSLTVGEQLRFWARLYGGRMPEPEAYGLKSSVPGQLLSAGQKRRLAFARLALAGRKLWLLDEPLAALDGEGKAMVATHLAAHCAAGGIAIAASHEPFGFGGLTLRLGEP